MPLAEVSRTDLSRKEIHGISEGPCQQGGSLNLPTGFSARQINRQLPWDWSSCPPASSPGSLGKWYEFLPYAILYSGVSQRL